MSRPRLNSVLELLLNVDRGFGENKKGRTLKNLEFSPLVEPGGGKSNYFSEDIEVLISLGNERNH